MNSPHYYVSIDGCNRKALKITPDATGRMLVTRGEECFRCTVKRVEAERQRRREMRLLRVLMFIAWFAVGWNVCDVLGLLFGA